MGHVVIGTILVALFLIQPFLGTLHHHLNKANKPKALLRYGHIWLGRILIILGMIEGGLGLWLAANSPGGEKVYGALAGIIGVSYIALLVFWYFKKDSDTGTNGNSDMGEAEKRVDSGSRLS